MSEIDTSESDADAVKSQTESDNSSVEEDTNGNLGSLEVPDQTNLNDQTDQINHIDQTDQGQNKVDKDLMDALRYTIHILNIC